MSAATTASDARRPRTPRRQRTASAALAFALCWCAASAGLAGPQPALPVPCIAGSCGAGAPQTWVSSGAATATQVGKTLTVNQSSNNAILNWQSFNIASGNSVNFKQPSAASLALNNIFQGSPSQIFGSLNANGRVYLINQNGIMFGNGAQVNVAGLVASSLNLATNAVQNGIAQTITGDPTDPSFVQFQDASGNPLPSGAVTVAKGATLNAPGGQIFLFAPTVSNQGTISTPDGQTILAAGNAVYLATSNDPSVRGLLVAVDGAGTVTNGSAANSQVTDPAQLVGQIMAQRGNVTMMGLAVNQDGLVSASTAVRANGSIKLIAANRAAGGELTLGAHSVTEAGLDDADTSQAVDATLQQKSSVALQGHEVTLAGGASVVATSGSVTATASSIGVPASTDAALPPLNATSDGSRIYLAPGASIDVSGATATLPMSSNVLQVQLRGSELADSPLQRNGPLRGETVSVDTRQYGTLNGTQWVGTPLANLSADFATIERGLQQRNETGGTVTLQSLGDVIVAPQATINVSGGASDFQGGFLNTSSLIGANGQLYNIASANPNILYKGIANTTAVTVTDQRWGVTKTYYGIYGSGQGQYQPGYVQGADAGSLVVNAPHVILDGALLANVQVGAYQRLPPSTLPAGALERPYDQLPLPGALALGATTSALNIPDLILTSIELAPGAVLPTLENEAGGAFNPLTDPWPSSLTVTKLNPAWLSADAAARIVLGANDTISVPAGVALQLPAGGSFSALAHTVDIAGSISGSGVPISLQTELTAPFPSPSQAGNITLAPSAVLDVAGAWVNDDPVMTAPPVNAPLLLNGGNVTLAANDGNVTLAHGALIDVSGGAQLRTNGTLASGAPGTIAVSTSNPMYTPTQLTLGATLRGFGIGQGGSLSLAANFFCVTGGTPCVAVSGEDPVTLSPAFFTQGGFGSYSLLANLGGLEVTAGTQLHPLEQNFLLTNTVLAIPAAATLSSVAAIGTLPPLQRQPVNLSFASRYVPPIASLGLQPITTPELFATAPDLSLDTGAAINLDPLANLSLSSNTRLLDDGQITVPGGTVAMTIPASLAEPEFIAGHQLWLGPNAIVSVRGTALTAPDATGHTVGTVLPGGTVTLTALAGAVETQPGSLIDASGTAATLDIQQFTPAGVSTFVSKTIGSAGGRISIDAAEAALLSGTLSAHSGSPASVPGGSFSLVLDGNTRYAGSVSLFPNSPAPYPYNPRTIDVAASQAPVVVARGADIDPNGPYEAKALVSAAALTAAGFDAVALQAVSLDPQEGGSQIVPGVIEFAGNVSLSLGRSLTLDAASFLSLGGNAQLAAPYVALGQTRVSTQQPNAQPPGNGTSVNGSLQVNASMIDLIGQSTFGSFSWVTLDSQGDIRANGVQIPTGAGAPPAPQFPGVMSVSGSLDLIAQEVYPSTLSNFTFTAAAAGSGILEIERAAGTAPTTLLSAGGTLTFNAPSITQAGVVRAPLGSIVMNAPAITLADGSITTTSADGGVIPFGATQGGFDWVYPISSNIGLLYGTDGIPLPKQSILLTSTSANGSINVSQGAIVDVKGGGDLLATEFIPGPTGTQDVLGSAAGFAILPTAGLRFAPFDPYYWAGSGVSPGQSVYLSGGAGLAAGTYAVLPARYALLPGAYYVMPVAGFTDLTPGQQFVQTDGSVIVSGYSLFAGTTLGDARTSAFDVRPGSAVQNLAQYTTTSANTFFSSQAAAAGVTAQRLPQDAGYLGLSASGTLALNGTLQATPGTGGRGAQLDITSAAIQVVGGSGNPGAIPGALVLDANQLTHLGAESILLGGVRNETGAGLQITTQATSVNVAGGADLEAPELLLTALDDVTVEGGATVGASGSLPTPESTIMLAAADGSGNGAFLRVAAAGTPGITRSGSAGSSGELSLMTGSVISAPGGAVAVDTAASAEFDGTLKLNGGAFSVGGGQISLGTVPAGTGGTVLPIAVLNGLALNNLALNSRSSIDFYDGADLSGTNVSLTAAALRGCSAAAAGCTTASSSNVQVIATDTLALAGNQGSVMAPAGGSGTLSLQGGTVTLGAGALDLAGFASVALSSRGALNLTASGSLSVEGDLDLHAALLTADSGARHQIGVNGAFTYSAPAQPAPLKTPAEDPLGASVAITAQSIDFNGAVRLHSGALALTATGAGGDVILGSAADIDLSAVKTVFDSVPVYSPGGTLSLQSQGGSVTALAGSRINVAALDDSLADAGSLSVQAATGSVNLGATLTGRDANFSTDAQTLGGFSALISSVQSGGFTGDWSLRQRGPGDLTVAAGQSIEGRSVSLTVDNGAIDIEGAITSHAAAGGAILLSALNDVTVNGSLDARPQSSGEMNGHIQLATGQGVVRIGSAASVAAFDPSVAVQSALDGGLWIRAPRSTVGQLSLAGNLQGLRSLTIEGFERYDASTTGTISATDVLADPSNARYADAANFMSTVPALLQSIGPVNGPAAQIVPGIEIDSSQSLALTQDWALDAWRFNGVAGVLTLRAAGDLNIQGSLSDGFTGTPGTNGADAYVLNSTGPSWSYRLAAGADLSSANPLAVQPLYSLASSSNGTGSLILAPGTPSVMTMIRTGTGSIDIAAAGDVVLSNSDSVIYTAGIAANGVTFSGRGQLNGLLYPTQGGNISISAGRNVVGAPTADLITNWLWRVGTPQARQPVATAWTVSFADFEQGVGALGGGNVTVSAGGDITDLSVSVPTVGRQIGSTDLAASNVQVLNEGQILLRAGGNVAGGVFYDGSGTLTATAGDQITASPTTPGLYPVIALSGASADLQARNGATLAGVLNPTLLSQGSAQRAGQGNNYSYFSTYGPVSALTLRTVAGTAELANDTSTQSAVVSQYTTVAWDQRINENGVSSQPYYALAIYPATLALESLRGAANIDNSLTLYPAPQGNVSILAHDSVTFGTPLTGSFQLIESDSDPALLPGATNPQGDLFTVAGQLAGFNPIPGSQNAAVPVHLQGSTPDATLSHVVSLSGDVALQTSGSTVGSELYFAAPARITAGQDVRDLAVDVQNLRPTDVSVITAARDITYQQSRSPTGQIEPVLSSIQVDGPGTLEVDAGRNVDLGSSVGILSRGNLVNPNLSSGGADISVQAGLGVPDKQNFSTFINDYLVNSTLYTNALVAYMQPFLGATASAAQALAAFQALPTPEQQPLILQIFFDELRASGRAAAAPGPTNANFTRGFDAITALYPGGNPDLSQGETNPYAGNISLFFSQIYTLDGGNIDLLAPGGLVNAGLATPPAAFGINKLPSQLGLVAQSTGSVNAYTYGDFEVNQSRVFAADGGNILLWSSEGNIDAGRGAKTAISAPPPTITYVNGVPTVVFPAALTGSGIQTLATSPGVSPGDVDLFAPHGVVNANDAGIVAGNLTIAATAVLGANNIKVSGVSVGVPVEVSGLGASLAAVNSITSSATQAATQSFEQSAAQSSSPIADTTMGWLEVFIEGFGEEVCKASDVECLKRQRH